MGTSQVESRPSLSSGWVLRANDVHVWRVPLNQSPEHTALAIGVLSPELATLRGLPESMRVKGFYNCWTRKEAYVKARGEGLSFPLKQFDVSLTPGDPAKLLEVRDDLDEIDRWTLHEIPVAENYVAALAVEGSNLSVTCRDWDLPHLIAVRPRDHSTHSVQKLSA